MGKKIEACALALMLMLVEGCATTAFNEFENDDMGALAERILADNQEIILSREYLPIWLPDEEVEELLRVMGTERWELSELTMAEKPSASKEGFSIQKSISGKTYEIWVDYEASSARAAYYATVQEPPIYEPEYMHSDKILDARQYSIPESDLLNMKSFEERVKMQYPVPRATGYDDLEAILKEVLWAKDGSRSILQRSSGHENFELSEKDSEDMLAATLIESWIPISDILNSSSTNYWEGSDYALSQKQYGSSDFCIYIFEESGIARIARTVLEISLNYNGDSELFQFMEYDIPVETIENMHKVYESIVNLNGLRYSE